MWGNQGIYGTMFNQQQSNKIKDLEKQLEANSNQNRPDIPEFESVLSNNGLLLDQYQLTDQMDTGALDQMRQESMREAGTNSPWADLMMEQLGQKEMQANDQVTRQTQGITDSLFSNMAASGGANAGSQERLGRSSIREMLRAKQNNRSGFDDQEMGVRVQDENNRMNALTNQVGLDTNRANYLTNIQGANNQGALTELGAKRNYDQDRFRTEASIWGADKNSNAMKDANQQQGGCFITTAFCEKLGLDDDHDVLMTMRDLRDNYLAKLDGGLEEIKKYYVIAPKILKKLPSTHADWEMIRKSVLRSFAYAKVGEKAKAHTVYKNMVNTLETNWLGGQ